MIVAALAVAMLSPRVERLHTGFRYTEGPVLDAVGNLYFTDVPTHRIYRRSTSGRLTLLTRRSGGCVGLEYGLLGLVGAQSATGRLVRMSAVDWNPKPMSDSRGSPNDLVADRTGGFYVTSPSFRNPKGDAILYFSLWGKISVANRTVRAPNGIALSPDRRTLYVVGYGTHDVRAFPILSPGRLGPGRRLMKLAGPGGKPANTGGDGMAVGPDGVLYVAIPEARGIHVARPDGRFVTFYSVPEKPSNCEVARDGRTLFVTAQRSVYAVRL